MDFCPICGDRPKFICKCPTASRICHNGHEWYLDMNKRYRLGNGHKEDGILYYGPIAEPLYEIVEYEDDRCPECGENAIHTFIPEVC